MNTAKKPRRKAYKTDMSAEDIEARRQHFLAGGEFIIGKERYGADKYKWHKDDRPDDMGHISISELYKSEFTYHCNVKVVNKVFFTVYNTFMGDIVRAKVPFWRINIINKKPELKLELLHSDPLPDPDPPLDNVIDLVYEYDLPKMSDEAYAEWFKKSKIVAGVRMGPKVEETK